MASELVQLTEKLRDLCGIISKQSALLPEASSESAPSGQAAAGSEEPEIDKKAVKQIISSLKKLKSLMATNLQEIHKAADDIRSFAQERYKRLGIEYYSANYPKVKEMFKKLYGWQFFTPTSLEDEKYIQELIYWFESRL